MSPSSPQHEPTMEEILASIRKIISEESPEGQSAPSPVQAKPATQEADVLIKQLLWTVLPLTVLGAIGLELLGPFILEHWSHGKIPFDRTVFSLLMVGSIFAASWQIRATQLTATNRHSFLALAFLVVSIGALFVAFLTGKLFGIASAAASTSLVELGMVLCTTWAISRVSRSNP